METIERKIENVIDAAVLQGVNSFLSGYNSPLHPIINTVIDKNKGAIQTKMESYLTHIIADEEFDRVAGEQIKKMAAKLLVAKFNGEMEKRINDLRSDSAFRAKMTIAIDDLVKEHLEQLKLSK